MKQDLTKIYDGADLAGATANVVYLPIVKTATLEKVSVRTDAAQIGNAVFEVRRNNVVIAGLTALTILNTAKIGTVSGLAIALVDGDEITLNLLSGNVSAPVTLNLGTDDGLGETAATLGNTIGAATAKTTPADADLLPLSDSAAMNIVKKLTWGNVKASLKTYFDAIYAPIGGGGGGYDGGRPTNPTFANAYESEDFLGGDVINNQSAKWQAFGGASIPTMIDSPDASHPGVYRGTTAAAHTGLYLGDNIGKHPVRSDSNFDLNFILRPNQITGTNILIGLAREATDISSPYICLEKLAADTSFFGSIKLVSGGATTRTALVLSPVAGTWYRFRIRRIGANVVGFSINGGIEQTINAVMTATAMFPFFTFNSSDGASKTLDIDFFDLQFTGLTRY